jgi:hypothetical protein
LLQGSYEKSQGQKSILDKNSNTLSNDSVAVNIHKMEETP